jgi:hypothetical protein
MKPIKFTEKIDGRTLSVSYYQDKRLKQIKNLKVKISPIYIRVKYNGTNSTVRSLLWKSLMNSHNEFIISQVYSNIENEINVVEGMADIESHYVKHKENFNYLCQYEFECIKKIIAFACKNRPEKVQNIVNAYEFWGKDGLRETSSRMLELLFEVYAKAEQDLFKQPSDVKRTAFNRILHYKHLSKNAINYLEVLVNSNFDSVGILSFANEIGINKIKTPVHLKEKYDALMWLIADLAFQYNFFPIHGEKNFELKQFISKSDPTPAGILYFPKIHFFDPIYKDEKTIHALSCLKDLLSKN